MLPLLTWTALPSLTCASKLEVTTFPRLNQTGEGFTSSLNGSLEEVATSSLNVGHAGWDIKVWPKFWSLLSFCLVLGFCFLVKICFTVLTFWWSLVGAFWTKNCLKRVLEQGCCTHFCAQSDLVVEGATHYSESRSYTGGSNKAQNKIFRTACSIPCHYHPPLQRRGLCARFQLKKPTTKMPCFFNTRPFEKKFVFNSKTTRFKRKFFRHFMLLILPISISGRPRPRVAQSLYLAEGGLRFCWFLNRWHVALQEKTKL